MIEFLSPKPTPPTHGDTTLLDDPASLSSRVAFDNLPCTSRSRRTLLAGIFTVAGIYSVAFATPARACDTIALNVASYHTDHNLIPDVNEFNPGFGCVIHGQDWGAFEVGAFLNSHNKASFYAIAMQRSEGIGWFAGLANGYASDEASVDGVLSLLGIQYAANHYTVRVAPSLAARDNQLGLVFSLSLNAQSFSDVSNDTQMRQSKDMP